MGLIRKKMRLGDVLINEGAITEEQLIKGLELQKQSKQRLGMTLVDAGITTEEAIAQALSHQLGYNMINLRDVAIEQSVLDLINVEILKKHAMIPIGYSAEEANVL